MLSRCPGDWTMFLRLVRRPSARASNANTYAWSKPIATPAARPVTTRSSISAAGIRWRGILISTSLPVCCTAMRGLIEPCAARASPPLGRGIGGRSWRYVSSGMSSVLIMWWRKEAGADAAMASRSASGHWRWLPIAWRARSEHALAQWLETDFVCDRHGRRWIAAWRDEAERKASRTPRVRVAGRQLQQWYRTLDQLIECKAQIEHALYPAAARPVLIAGRYGVLRSDLNLFRGQGTA